MFFLVSRSPRDGLRLAEPGSPRERVRTYDALFSSETKPSRGTERKREGDKSISDPYFICIVLDVMIEN
jgi:hypothetical protein